MANVILIIHLILALALIAVVLLQRSEGGALGIGGGGGGLTTARSAGNALTKVTWAIAAAFIATSLVLTVLAARDTQSRSVIDRLEAPFPAGTPPQIAPPAADDDGGLAPGLGQLLTPLPGAPAPTDGGAVAPPPVTAPPAAD